MGQFWKKIHEFSFELSEFEKHLNYLSKDVN